MSNKQTDIGLKLSYSNVDENSNNNFDTFLSIPKEKYGFSNDAPVFLGPPEFKEAAFFLKKGETIEIEISLR